MKKIIFLYLFLVLVVIGLAVIKFTGVTSLLPGFSKSEAQTIIKDTTFETEVAKDDAAKQKGLSKRKSLKKDAGLLFIFDKKGRHAFWMKDMLFPIDIIFIEKKISDSISEGTIVYIAENVKAPSKDATPSTLEIYSPNKDADLVFEVNAGISKDKGFKVGDQVRFENIK